MVYGYALIPNQFYRQYMKFYISHQSQFISQAITIYICSVCLFNLHYLFWKPYSYFLSRNHSYPIFRQYGFGGMGTGWHATCLRQTVTMIDSGMNSAMRASPRNFIRTSGRVELPLFWNFQTCSCCWCLCHHFSEPAMVNTANTEQSQRREVIVKRFRMTLFKHLDPPGPALPLDLLVT